MSNSDEIVNTNKNEVVLRGESAAAFARQNSLQRTNQFILLVLGIIEVLLMFRFILKALGASSFNGFTYMIYFITYPLVIPFEGILRNAVSGGSVIDSATIFAGIVYLLTGWALIYFITLMFPATVRNVRLM